MSLRRNFRFVIIGLSTGLLATLSGWWWTDVRQPTANANQNSSAVCQISVAERVQQAELILRGSVFAVVPRGTYGARVIITPDYVYKGRLDRPTVEIEAIDDQNQSGRLSTTGLHFTSVQPPYLLYLVSTPEGAYTTSACHGSRFFGSGLTPEERVLLAPTGE